jgi:hypothetical protein
MVTIPAIWCPVVDGFPILEKPMGTPFLLLDENPINTLFERNKTNVMFKFIEVAVNKPEPDLIKDEILKLMRRLYDAWAGVLPNYGHAQFYGYLRGKLTTIVDPNPTNTIHFVHVGIGYSTYPIEVNHGVPERVKAWCDDNQLPLELVIP